MLASEVGEAADWTTAQPITVIAMEYAFAPSHLEFRRAAHYRLHIENRGKETHEFTAPEFFKTIEAGDWAPLNADHTEIDVQPGQQVDFYFIAKTAGAFPLRCADHDWAGMTGGIVVRP